MGQFIDIALLHRSILVLPRACYDFVQRVGRRRARVWPSVARECRWIVALLPLVRADLRANWDDSATVSDASLTGVGGCEDSWPEARVKSLDGSASAGAFAQACQRPGRARPR